MKTLRDIGEIALLKSLLPLLPQTSRVRTGPGDDCAVTRHPGSPEDDLFTTDAVIEGLHFLPDTPPRWIARKAIARAVSDIAAMGGTPRALLLNLVAPPSTPLPRIRLLYRGLTDTARTFRMAILGGDTSQGPRLELHVTAIGSIPRGTAVLRSGARPGDALYVTGSLGGAWLPGSRHHFLFSPRLAEGRFLARHRYASAMMDLSDGLAADLPRLLEASHCGVRLSPTAIPLSPAARRTSNPLRHACCDGEDFELLFTVSARQQAAFLRAWPRAFPRLPVSCIGQILPDPRLREGLPKGGWNHFR